MFPFTSRNNHETHAVLHVIKSLITIESLRLFYDYRISRNKKSKHDLKISINEENIKQVQNINFLGIVIDEFLTWRDHIDLIAKKIIKCAAIISRIRHFTNLNSLKLIYYALVYPYLTYGNLIWGNAYKSHIRKLVNIQKNNCKINNI